MVKLMCIISILALIELVFFILGGIELQLLSDDHFCINVLFRLISFTWIRK